MKIALSAIVLLFAPQGAMAAQAAPSAGTAGQTLPQFETRQVERVMAADSDGDGRVSLAESQASMKAGKTGKTGVDPSKRFVGADANQDGYLDKGEIDAMIARRFSHRDRDGDGVLTAQERMGARNARQAATPDE